MASTLGLEGVGFTCMGALSRRVYRWSCQPDKYVPLFVSARYFAIPPLDLLLNQQVDSPIYRGCIRIGSLLQLNYVGSSAFNSV